MIWGPIMSKLSSVNLEWQYEYVYKPYIEVDLVINVDLEKNIRVL